MEIIPKNFINEKLLYFKKCNEIRLSLENYFERNIIILSLFILFQTRKVKMIQVCRSAFTDTFGLTKNLWKFS